VGDGVEERPDAQLAVAGAGQRGFRRARQADTVVAALAGACDGELSIGPLLDAIAHLLDRDPSETRATYLPVVRELVDEGFLVSAPG